MFWHLITKIVVDIVTNLIFHFPGMLTTQIVMVL